MNSLPDSPIQAIETRYAGCRFRSRLEARWAVFFDTLDIEWQYESEGFDLPHAGLYLPDFFFPKWALWMEIKGVDPSRDELHKLECFRDYIAPIVLFIGPPSFGGDGRLYCNDVTDSSGGSSEWDVFWGGDNRLDACLQVHGGLGAAIAYS